jgi:6-pyruvoyltetrahydropterin/6-carboxytetrahydropterin synthase
MFELTVQTVFSAAHAIVIAGAREPLHGHDWHVTACVSGDALDAEGLLVDFHALEETLGAIVRPFRNANLNETAPFDRVNPTAENVARHIGTTLAERVRSIAARGVRVTWVRVTEAPGCAVTYRM